VNEGKDGKSVEMSLDAANRSVCATYIDKQHGGVRRGHGLGRKFAKRGKWFGLREMAFIFRH